MSMQPPGHEPGDYSRFPLDHTPGFNRWEPLEIPAFSTGGFDQPFQVFAIALKSSSRQSEVFIHDPVRFLTGRSQGVDTWAIDEFEGEPLLDQEPTRINSVVLRHERTLEHMVVRSMAVMDDDGSVTLVTHKQESG
jgi:hypothetical protein